MPSKADHVRLLNEFVCSIYDYSCIDPEWMHSATAEASDAREKMYACARKIMLFLADESLSADEIDEIFDWEVG